jgi:hypothetical protein
LWFKRKPKPDAAQIVKQSAQDWLPFKDIFSGAMYKRDGAIVAVLRVDPLNISLKSEGEKQRIISAVHEAINGQREPFQIICLPRALDLDQYLSSLNDRLKNTTDNLKRRLQRHQESSTSSPVADLRPERGRQSGRPTSLPWMMMILGSSRIEVLE